MAGPRVVDIFVRDREGRLIPGATIKFTVDGEPAGSVDRGDGRARIELPNRTSNVAVYAAYKGKSQTVPLAQAQDSYTFAFDVYVVPPWRKQVEKHLALIVGLILFAVAAVLTFVFSTPTPLQTRVILGFFSLGGGAIATEISGMIDVHMSLGKKLTIGATRALAVFVILYLVVPPQPT
jgi:hypothetical protein